MQPLRTVATQFTFNKSNLICTNLVCSVDVDLHDQVPILILHVLEADVSQDASIVDQDVYPAEILDGGIDDSLAILDAVVVGNRLTASGFDLVDD